ERLVEFRLPARMRVGIALHQPAQLDDAYCMRVVVPRDLARRGKPSVSMRGLALVAKEPAAETTQTTEDIKRKKPADGVGLHAAATIDHAVELLEQTRPRLDEAAERDWQGADDLLHARMHELGGGDELIRRSLHLGAHAR